MKDDVEGERGEVDKILDLEMGMPLGTTTDDPPALTIGFFPLDTGKRLDEAEGVIPWWVMAVAMSMVTPNEEADCHSLARTRKFTKASFDIVSGVSGVFRTVRMYPSIDLPSLLSLLI